MEAVVIRKLSKLGSSYLVTLPKDWAEDIERLSKYIVLRRRKDGTIEVRPWAVMGEED